MSIILGDEVVRNIPEQVADNTEEIAAIKHELERRYESHKIKTYVSGTPLNWTIYGLYATEIQACITAATDENGVNRYTFFDKLLKLMPTCIQQNLADPEYRTMFGATKNSSSITLYYSTNQSILFQISDYFDSVVFND